MKFGKKNISLSLLILILITFILPFLTISCQNQEIVTLNGFQLVTGKTIDDASADEKVPANPFIIIVLLLTVGGIIYCWKIDNINSLIVGSIGGVNLIFLILFKSNFTKELMKKGGGNFEVNYKIGFWATVLAAMANLCFHVYLQFVDNNKTQEGEGDTEKDREKLSGGDFVNVVKSTIEMGIGTIGLKSKNIVETTKLNSQISSLQGDKKRSLEALGNRVYEMNSMNSIEIGVIKEICFEIKAIDRKIEENKKLIDDIQNS